MFRTARFSLFALGALLATSVHAFDEVGIDDQRLSDTGPAMNPAYDATAQAIAWNAEQQRFIVCWNGDDTVLDDVEIYCEILTASGGVLLDDALMSFHGPAGTAFSAVAPDVVYNPNQDEYLVCWHGDTTDGGTLDNENEIYCRRFDQNATPIGGRVRVSSQGGDGDAEEDAFNVSIAHNFQDDNYLICWRGDVIATGIGANDEYEVFCRLMESDGTLPAPQFKASNMGTNGDAQIDVGSPAVVYGGTAITTHEFLVCWNADHDQDGQVEGEDEIFCRRFDGDDAAPLGAQVRMTTQGGLGNTTYAALGPSIAFDPFRLRYLVCWHGDAPGGATVDNENEAWCGEWNRSLSPTAAPARVSWSGTDGNAANDNTQPIAIWNGTQGWAACFLHSEPPLEEVACQLLSTTLAPFGPAGGIVSSISSGPGGYSDPLSVDVGRNSASGEWLVAWSADTEEAGMVELEFEVFAQRVDPFRVFVDGFESGNSIAWSATAP